MTKIQLKLGVALAAALIAGGVSLAPHRADAGEPQGYPEPEEWDAVMEYLEAIAVNDADTPNASPEPARPAAEPELAPPPAAPVEAAVPANDAGSAAAPVQPVMLPNTGVGSDETSGIRLEATMLAVFGAGMVVSLVALRRRMSAAR